MIFHGQYLTSDIVQLLNEEGSFVMKVNMKEFVNYAFQLSRHDLNSQRTPYNVQGNEP